jgi:hypothetical protein
MQRLIGGGGRETETVVVAVKTAEMAEALEMVEMAEALERVAVTIMMAARGGCDREGGGGISEGTLVHK